MATWPRPPSCRLLRWSRRAGSNSSSLRHRPFADSPWRPVAAAVAAVAAEMLASFPEKKALVYFSGGVTRSGLDNEAQLQATINAAAKANLAIYSIDARGLTADPPGGGASKGASRGSGIYNGAVFNSQRSAQL